MGCNTGYCDHIYDHSITGQLLFVRAFNLAERFYRNVPLYFYELLILVNSAMTQKIEGNAAFVYIIDFIVLELK